MRPEQRRVWPRAVGELSHGRQRRSVVLYDGGERRVGLGRGPHGQQPAVRRWGELAGLPALAGLCPRARASLAAAEIKPRAKVTRTALRSHGAWGSETASSVPKQSKQSHCSLLLWFPASWVSPVHGEWPPSEPERLEPQQASETRGPRRWSVLSELAWQSLPSVE